MRCESGNFSFFLAEIVVGILFVEQLKETYCAIPFHYGLGEKYVAFAAYKENRSSIDLASHFPPFSLMFLLFHFA